MCIHIFSHIHPYTYIYLHTHIHKTFECASCALCRPVLPPTPPLLGGFSHKVSIVFDIALLVCPMAT